MLHVLPNAGMDLPIAVLADGRHGPYIVEAKPNRRGEVHGRRVTEHMVGLYLEKDIPVVEIQCAPRSSIPFWQRMRFQMYWDDHTYRVLEKPWALSSETPRAPV